ncbi:hypothetical protein ACIGHF_17795 [Stenotrophomonas sp. NPDC077464]|uniref:hypothetical protein n=1 Tax=unclassified Stenotrophomonas TaxID=196198 RepID=UPI0037D789A6
MLTSIRGPASFRLKETPRNLVWCGAVVFGNYAKTTGRTGRVVTVVMVVVPMARPASARPPWTAVMRSVAVAAGRTMAQENYGAALLVKCCIAEKPCSERLACSAKKLRM